MRVPGTRADKTVRSRADRRPQNGETYNKWIAYGQSKTANLLFALSLAEKLGGRGLGAYSLHPGVIGGTGLSAHLDFSATGDFAELRTPHPQYVPDVKVSRLTRRVDKLDQTQGNAEGFEAFNFINPEQGAATHVFAAFDPSLKGNYAQALPSG